VVTVLRDGLGAGYNVPPRMATGRTAFQGPHEGRPNTIVVGTSGNQFVKAQVTITPRGGQTELRISPGGIPGARTWTSGSSIIREYASSRPEIGAVLSVGSR
jgi:hypothetical protein